MLVRKAINGAGRSRSLRKGFKPQCWKSVGEILWSLQPLFAGFPHDPLQIDRHLNPQELGPQASHEMSLLDGILYIATMTCVRRRWSLVLKLSGELRRRKLKVDTDAGALFFVHVVFNPEKAW